MLFNDGMGIIKFDWGTWLGLECLVKVIGQVKVVRPIPFSSFFPLLHLCFDLQKIWCLYIADIYLHRRLTSLPSLKDKLMVRTSLISLGGRISTIDNKKRKTCWIILSKR